MPKTLEKKTGPEVIETKKKKTNTRETIALLSLVLIVLMLAWALFITRLLLPIIILGIVYYICSNGKNPLEMIK